MKLIMIFLIITGMSQATTSDVYCIPMGDDYLYCTDNNGNEWNIYTGE